MQYRILIYLFTWIGLQSTAHAEQLIPLSLKEAVEAALDPAGATRIQLAHEAVRQAEARAAQLRAELLPDISASVGQQRRAVNLAQFGLNSSSLPSGPRPFNTFEARSKVTMRLFDLSTMRRFQSARAGTEAVRQESKEAKDKTAAEVARAYLAAVRAQALVQTAQANVSLSDALRRLAVSQKESGAGTGIEVTRSEVQLANNRQSLLVAEADFTKARLELLKTVGVDLDTEVTLTDSLSYAAVAPVSVREAMASAAESLAELLAQRMHEESARLNYRAAVLERMPSVVGFADYGVVGFSANDSSPTRTVGASVHIPIFNGGRVEARRAESASRLEQERIRSAELQDQVELRIRIALDAVRSAEAQVQTAESGLTLANEELEQAERRYRAGVGGSIEVTDAQTRLQRARDNRVSAIFNHSLARIDLAASTGTIHEVINNWR
jgi:outer membrane protein TolC